VERELLSRRVEAFRGRVVALQRRHAEAPAQHDVVLAAALEELDTAYEELRAAEDELSRQATALALAEETVQEERRRYRELFEAAPDGYLVTDTQGNILDANRAATVLLNCLQQFLIGKPLATFLAPGEALAFRFRLLRLAQMDQPEDWQMRLQPPNRPPVVAAVTVAVVRNAEDRPVGLQWLLRDVTERERVEQALRDSAQQAAASRLEGVALAARDLAHLLDSDLGLIVATLESLRHRLDLPGDLRALAEAQAALDRTVAHVAQLQQVVRTHPPGPEVRPPRPSNAGG
jgi:PAS domain S-box-containing protein